MVFQNIIDFFKGHVVLSEGSPTQWPMTFQDPATPVINGIVELHHEVIALVTFVVVFVGVMLFGAINEYTEGNTHNEKSVVDVVIHAPVLEVVWTVIPALILMVLAVPSFVLLYAADEMVDPALTLQVVGHQWYWSYEYSDYENEDGESLQFDSYIIPSDDLEEGQLRLLSVDNEVVLPVDTHIRVIVTAADVLHCWAVPSFGIKLDACPGRLNQVGLFIQRQGTFFGQCSEICGVNHGFMPIAVNAVSLEDYCSWIQNQLAGEEGDD
jgi:cytochrome c oxidase subunit 2